MSAHWYWDWGSAPPWRGTGHTGVAPATQTQPAPPDPCAHMGGHIKDNTKEIPENRIDGNKVCIKHIRYVGDTEPPPNSEPTDIFPTDPTRWHKIRLRELDPLGNPVDPSARDEWYWVCCEPAKKCCSDCEYYSFQVMLPTAAHAPPTFIQDFKCKCIK